MQVFKYYFKILKEYKGFILLYTVLLVAFGILNFSTNKQTIGFEAEKPSIAIINNDSMEGITQDLYNYLDKNTEILEIEEDKISDALFYREISYIIYIPENFSKDLLNDKNPLLEIKSTGDYTSSYAEMLVNKYLDIAKLYLPYYANEKELIAKINSSLDTSSSVKIMSDLDTTSLTKATSFYNFASYSLLAGSIYVISMIMFSFRETSIHKRTSISSINYSKYNRSLLLGNSIFVLVLWLFYIIISFILLKDAMFSIHGLYYMLNSFIYSLTALSIGFLISNIVKSKDGIGGLVNVVGLGSAFLCGAFVPMELLPDFVLKFARILPTYWFIKNNEILKTLEIININTLKPFLTNLIILLIFSLVFIIITNYISKKKRKLNV